MNVMLALPSEALEAIAERAAELVLEKLRAEHVPARGGRWPLYGARAAAGYLGWPVGRVQKLTAANAITCHRVDGGPRVTYFTDELDEWLERNYDGPPRGVAPPVRRL